MNQSEILLTCSNRACRFNFTPDEAEIIIAGWGYLSIRCPKCTRINLRPRKEVYREESEQPTLTPDSE
jgi:phage FluMu protein Com